MSYLWMYAIPITVFLTLSGLTTYLYRKETNSISYWIYLIASIVISVQIFLQIYY